MRDVEQRLRRVERTNRVLIGVIVLGGLVAAVPRGDDEVRAKRFVVVDDDGVEKATFGTSRLDGTSIRFEGQKDNHAASFGMNKDGRPSLFMKDPGTHGVVSFSWTSGERSLYMLGKDGDGTKRFEVGAAREPGRNR